MWFLVETFRFKQKTTTEKKSAYNSFFSFATVVISCVMRLFSFFFSRKANFGWVRNERKRNLEKKKDGKLTKKFNGIMVVTSIRPAATCWTTQSRGLRMTDEKLTINARLVVLAWNNQLCSKSSSWISFFNHFHRQKTGRTWKPIFVRIIIIIIFFFSTTFEKNEWSRGREEGRGKKKRKKGGGGQVAYLWCANRVVCVSSPKAFMQAVALVSTFWILLFFFFFSFCISCCPTIENAGIRDAAPCETARAFSSLLLHLNLLIVQCSVLFSVFVVVTSLTRILLDPENYTSGFCATASCVSFVPMFWCTWRTFSKPFSNWIYFSLNGLFMCWTSLLSASCVTWRGLSKQSK